MPTIGDNKTPIRSRTKPQARAAARHSAHEDPIVVATDGSEASDSALRAGLSLTSAGGTIQVVAVLAPLPIVTPEAQLAINAEIVDQMRDELREQAAAQLSRIGVPRGITVVLSVHDGQPVAVIDSFARRVGARLIVAGLGRHHLVDRLFGTETTLGLIRVASVPVLAVSPPYFGPPLRIVVGIDFSEASIRAARQALSIAAPRATIDLVHVTPSEAGPSWHRWTGDYRRLSRMELQSVESRLTVPAGMTIHRVVLEGDAADAILQHADDVGADLIVTGSHGHGLIGRMLIGSVATKIVRSTSISVLGVPHVPVPLDE
jgi:nucleotide-binding universal stress UspA family protein